MTSRTIQLFTAKVIPSTTAEGMNEPTRRSVKLELSASSEFFGIRDRFIVEGTKLRVGDDERFRIVRYASEGLTDRVRFVLFSTNLTHNSRTAVFSFETTGQAVDVVADLERSLVYLLRIAEMVNGVRYEAVQRIVEEERR